MAIIGISGSPIVNGNTDRMIKALLDKSGKETKFINLSTLRFDPCRACAHLCATTNMCGRKDDLQPYIKDIRDAEALVLGSPIHHGNMTGWMYSFITRLWCLYQVKELLKGKPAVFVSVGIHDKEIQRGISTFQSIATYSEKFNVLGHIYYNSSTPPCFKCGAGNYCKVGGIWGLVRLEDPVFKEAMYHPNEFSKRENAKELLQQAEIRAEKRLHEFQFTSDKFKRWEDCQQTVEEINRYAKILSEL